MADEFQVKIENVVAFTSLDKKIPLLEISNKFEDAEYAPESFPGVVYRIKDPRAATLIFSSGKIVCTGAKSIEKAKEAMHKVVNDIRKLGIRLPVKFTITVENIVASTQIAVSSKQTINLEEISFALENVEYEPEQFPGLVCRISEPRVAFLVFGSGKIICTGARKIEDIYVALGKLKEKLESIGVKVKPMKWMDEEGKAKEVNKPKPKK
ncbi:MAG: TATA-box-binding protein [Candidatus Aenigmarchaeota archaeon]|nr:TATA-box-binding protein [Candidatus Aenigmarchaeota archaeon]